MEPSQVRGSRRFWDQPNWAPIGECLMRACMVERSDKLTKTAEKKYK